MHMAMSPIELSSHASVTRGPLVAWAGASAGAPARALDWRLAAEAVKLWKEKIVKRFPDTAPLAVDELCWRFVVRTEITAPSIGG